MEDLEDLYQSIILDHNKRPRNFGKLEPHTHHAEGLNPLCGDEIEVYLRIEDGRVAAVTFDGQGCAISRASASLMTLKLKGMTVSEAEKEIAKVQAWLTAPEEPETDLTAMGDLVALLGVRKFPARIKCATLGWHTFEAAVEGKEEISTEG